MNLIMISEEIAYKQNIIDYISQLKSKNNKIILAPNKNLVECTDFYIDEFKKNKAKKGLIVWITGVAVANLLNKSLKNVNSIVTPSYTYYKKSQKNLEFDILVIGEMNTGYKNVLYIVKDFLEGK